MTSTKKIFNAKDYTNAPQQLRKTRLINAPIEEVWDVVANHGGMTEWMPMISHVELTKPNANGEFTEGCERECQFGPDLLKEKIVFWDAPYGYAYQIADMHLVKDHVGYIQLQPKGSGTEVIWTQYFYPNSNFAMNFVARQIMMPGVMSKALKNLGKQVA
ncbi:SRPBCC family protein [Lewinella sp. 4G2]|uniref:SRPBCC family protein n=1 Tax=Lewinella sp. 4G2 TaxID=1803372 RepID=UPI0007B4C008|nr:SRPBCC family protein [Lewinella sp. 4G2]OAV45189.1 hypothetical protein A3850_012100 [Lewinella sp. 4G2]